MRPPCPIARTQIFISQQYSYNCMTQTPNCATKLSFSPLATPCFQPSLIPTFYDLGVLAGRFIRPFVRWFAVNSFIHSSITASVHGHPSDVKSFRQKQPARRAEHASERQCLQCAASVRVNQRPDSSQTRRCSSQMRRLLTLKLQVRQRKRRR